MSWCKQSTKLPPQNDLYKHDAFKSKASNNYFPKTTIPTKMHIICSLFIIATITLSSAFGDNLPCRVQLTHEHKCFKRRAYESVDHMTTPIADQLQRCFDDNFGKCMLKLGVFAQLSGFSNDAGQQKALKECHFEHFLKYHMQIVACIKKEHSEMNPNLLLGLPDDKALPAACPDNKDEDRALLVAVVGGRLAKDLKCPSLEKCLRDASIDFDSLQSTTCAAKKRCKREHIQEDCRNELRGGKLFFLNNFPKIFKFIKISYDFRYVKNHMQMHQRYSPQNRLTKGRSLRSDGRVCQEEGAKVAVWWNGSGGTGGNSRKNQRCRCQTRVWERLLWRHGWAMPSRETFWVGVKTILYHMKSCTDFSYTRYFWVIYKFLTELTCISFVSPGRV